MLNGVTIHADLETFLKSTCSTLVTSCFVNHTKSIRFWFANILAGLSYRTLEKSSTSITSVNTIMFTRAVITTNFAWYIVQNSAWKDEKNCTKLVGITKLTFFLKSGEKKLKHDSIVHRSHPVENHSHKWIMRRLKSARIAILFGEKSIRLHKARIGITTSIEISTGETSLNKQEMKRFPPHPLALLCHWMLISSSLD